MMRSPPQPPEKCWYESLENESASAYKAFCLYRDLGRDRSLRAAYNWHLEEKRLQKGVERASKHSTKKAPPGRWYKWSTDFHWVSRAAAFDSYIERQDIDNLVRERLQWRRRIRRRRIKCSNQIDKIATEALSVFQGKESTLATQPCRWTLRDLASLISEGEKQAQLAVGEATEEQEAIATLAETGALPPEVLAALTELFSTGVSEQIPETIREALLEQSSVISYQ
ncbi:MAG: hypothetical protein BRC39_00780 [Cyanobacteria bacterium QH_7_48_89]|jgi:hypothetical protein|nr:MAG: hypothetical protein BRC39_00780 [Cyanobacteria bacterium QH_7_48_89]